MIGNQEERILENIEELEHALNTNRVGVVCIKPRVLFQLIEKKFQDPLAINLPIPSSKIGSVTTLEASLICALLKLQIPKTIFEFGTFLGYTTSIFLMNSPSTTKIFSIDLPITNQDVSKLSEVDWNLVQSNDAYNDQFLTQLAFQEGEYYLRNFEKENNLKLIKSDSLLFEPGDYFSDHEIDFVFIDGGHTDSVVKSDTSVSLRMRSENALVLWHDFNSTIHGKVTEVVKNYAQGDLVLHVQHTLLALTGTNFLKSLFEE